MDNPLTPKRIQKLINLAEGRSFNMERLLLTEEDVKMITAQENLQFQEKSPAKYESSSGIIDLDHVEAFGDSGSNMNMSLSKSTSFNPGEITGRSTGADGGPALSVPSEIHGRHSIAIDSITSQMDKQTIEIHDLMRHSIASNYSFHSKRDLTADEASLVAREAPLPVMQTTHTYFGDTMSINSSNMSVGAYFGKRCMDFEKILGKTDSPDRSYMMPSITEVSGTRSDYGKDTDLIRIDDTLDSVPVRQPKNSDTKVLEKTSTISSKKFETPHNPVFKQPARPKPTEKSETVARVLEQPKHIRSLNPAGIPPKVFSSSKPTDVLLKNLQASFKMVTEDTEETVENSISLSKIADFLGKQSDVSLSDMLQLQNKPGAKKQPLTELNMNKQNTEGISVTKLIDTKKAETASSSGSVYTVISFDRPKINEKSKDIPRPRKEVPEVLVTLPEQDFTNVDQPQRTTRSKSPSSRSPSTLSTVRDNYSNNSSTIKAENSPNSGKEEANRSKVPSPNIAYKELDNSVNWKDVLQQKKIRQRAKEKWVEIVAKPVDGFIGVTTAVTISVTTLTDNWLTGRFQFDSLPNDGKELNVELSRLPILLSPGKSEDFTFHMTSNIEMNTILPFTFYIKDASIDGEIEQKGELRVNFKIPLIQAMSSDGLNQLTYPVVPSKTAITRSFVLISDCPADLQLKLAITEGEGAFCIKNIQEIKKNDVNKVLTERQSAEDFAKPKAKTSHMQLCRLAKDSAIKVSITFNSPKLDMKLFGKSGIMTAYNGALQLTLIGSNTVLRKVDLAALQGIPRLYVDVADKKLHVANDPEKFTVSNRGSVVGTWSVRYRHSNEGGIPFEFSPTRFSLAAEATNTVQVFYMGKPEDGLVESQIFIEELTTGETTELILTAGVDKPKSFPIKSNALSLSWVRSGRKEVSLKNNSDKKVHVRCQIVGEGFSIDMPGGESRGIYLLSFNGLECRPLPIVFAPTSCVPYSATLYMVLDKQSDSTSRKVKLFGFTSGEPVRWSGLVTYSDTAALVRAGFRVPIDLKLHNKSTMPAFVAAKVHFNLQYMQVERYCRLVGARNVVPGRAVHTVSLRVDWPRVERKAREGNNTALATVTVLTGAEAIRRRIIKILKDESQGRLDASLLPEHLRVLTEEFDGEDPHMDNLFVEFTETKDSLGELIHCGLQELTAHVDLPQDFAEDNTIIIADDTVLDHQTMCD